MLQNQLRNEAARYLVGVDTFHFDGSKMLYHNQWEYSVGTNQQDKPAIGICPRVDTYGACKSCGLWETPWALAFKLFSSTGSDWRYPNGPFFFFFSGPDMHVEGSAEINNARNWKYVAQISGNMQNILLWLSSASILSPIFIPLHKE